MKILLLHLESPLQSWSTTLSVAYSNKQTEVYPTKSGLIGLICAAQGIDRVDHIKHQKVAAEFKYCATNLNSAAILTDFQTVIGAAKIDGSIRGNAIILKKQYLVDAHFIVAITHPQLDLIEAALRKPKWPLYLGRKCCIPEPIIREGPILSERLIDPIHNLACHDILADQEYSGIGQPRVIWLCDEPCGDKAIGCLQRKAYVYKAVLPLANQTATQ